MKRSTKHNNENEQIPAIFGNLQVNLVKFFCKVYRSIYNSNSRKLKKMAKITKFQIGKKKILDILQILWENHF